MRKDLLYLVCLLPTCLFAEATGPRQQAELLTDYHGAHMDTFRSQYDRVRLLYRQAQLEASARLGLIQFREGFQYPMRIRFEDGAPEGLESILAYVRLYSTPQGFAQELVVNLDTTAFTSMDFDQIFTHEMTHAVMNDAVGGEATRKIPHWVQEGLAQYVSGEGPARVLAAAQGIRRSQAERLVFNLDGRYSGAAYPQYYLAIQYMFDKFSSNAVQTLVRNLIGGKPINEAIEDALGFPYAKFTENVRQYSLGVFQEKAHSDY